MHFDRSDILAAYNLYSCFYGGDGYHYENGIRCRLSRIKYRPSQSEEYLSGLSENAKEIYAALVRKHNSTLVATERFIKRYRANEDRASDPLGRYLYSTPYARIWCEAEPREEDAIDCYRPEA